MSFYFFIPGVNTNTADVDGWHERAERACERRGLRANSYPYHVTALTRWVFQAGHVKKAMRCLRESVMENEPIVVATHSNGAAIVVDMLRQYHDWHVSELHLIAGAADASYEENGLNAAVERGQIGEIFVYFSPHDRALRAAKATRGFLKWLGLGYGWLGLNGPTDMSAEAKARTTPVLKPGFDHSSYFDPMHFRDTMRDITGLDHN